MALHETTAKWVNNGHFVYRRSLQQYSSKFAIYDLDGTLTESFVQQHMIHHRKMGYYVAIISNQYGISKGKRTHHEVQSLIDQIHCDITVIYALNKDHYRKPMTGMFEFLVSEIGQQDVETSFYCGDAAGRRGDHSVCDYFFAHNCGLKFLSVNAKDKSVTPYENHNLFYKIPNPLDQDPIKDLIYTSPFIIIMVGPQGSGKTSLSNKISINTGAVILSKDLHGTKINKLFKDHLSKGNNIIIDNTNPSADQRITYLQPAIDKGYYTTAIFMDIPKSYSTHLCHVRTALGKKYIPLIARHIYYKNLKIPSRNEGLQQIITVKGWYNNQLTIPPEYYYQYHHKET